MESTIEYIFRRDIFRDMENGNMDISKSSVETQLKSYCDVFTKRFMESIYDLSMKNFHDDELKEIKFSRFTESLMDQITDKKLVDGKYYNSDLYNILLNCCIVMEPLFIVNDKSRAILISDVVEKMVFKSVYRC
jgi:hypothetical protein